MYRQTVRATISTIVLLQDGEARGLDLDRGGGRDAARRGGRPGIGEVAVFQQPQHLLRRWAALDSRPRGSSRRRRPHRPLAVLGEELQRRREVPHLFRGGGGGKRIRYVYKIEITICVSAC